MSNRRWAIARFARSVPLTLVILGFALLHPRLYACTRYAGLMSKPSKKDSMKTAKEQAIDSISRLPSDVTWQDIVYCLYVRRRMEEGIKAADEGRILSHDEVKKLFER